MLLTTSRHGRRTVNLFIRLAGVAVLIAALLLPSATFAGTRGAARDIAGAAHAFSVQHPTAIAAKKKKKATKKRCVVKRRNKKGKLVVVYKTKVKRVVVKKHGKPVLRKGRPLTKKKRVFVYRYTKKKVKRHGSVVVKRVRHKIPLRRKCKNSGTGSTPGFPLSIKVGPPSKATLDFGAFVRDIPLSGTIKGFITGGGFKLGEDNQITLTRGEIDLAPTGIFIDDVCNDQVSDAIRTDPHTFAEIDQGSTSNVTVRADNSITGLLHMRVQTALQMRNDDDGCNKPYVTTGWTDFTVPLFVKGKLAAGSGGLQSTISTGETVLDQLSACLAQGDPELPCNGFAIPFPAIFTSKIVGDVILGS